MVQAQLSVKSSQPLHCTLRGDTLKIYFFFPRSGHYVLHCSQHGHLHSPTALSIAGSTCSAASSNSQTWQYARSNSYLPEMDAWSRVKLTQADLAASFPQQTNASPHLCSGLSASFQSYPQTQKYLTQAVQQRSQEQQDTEQFLPTAQQQDKKIKNQQVCKLQLLKKHEEIKHVSSMGKSSAPGFYPFWNYLIPMTVFSSGPASSALRQSRPEKS